ncbi:class I SAM-dependent methyltransferase [Rhodoblastus acidophilus]|uniref:Class I SAM-dependent methyltransferase n=1 Tax=Candidatus Rhodoblastus alkanivorans TaxID=2954117 RepID=A0ABS9Z9N2_9HYPH|nr:methyltransferase domain-containing protein [Candidatus Rhodoblastus alkanivorans]MCI4677046.1 class I SAM-dependent methyltransferase [Candidatus Rhodoblastus alkanivorans]MCI4684399.1 class I SAM-dependent methyltransferase [Candidatus Rhodoblastus alkanivorans]MDI4641720.1 class I SAM-dependent methyltransferase [Rhodoblastus acidophilus]
MEGTATNEAAGPPRVLAAIASYGAANDRYLKEIIRTYRSMSFAVDIVVLSDIDKGPAFGVECRVGLPAKNPWSLPFAHRKLFVERRDRYDLFIYSEDDILISERNLRAFIEVNAALAEDEAPGFLRVEHGPDGETHFPDAHAFFHWDPSSVRRRGPYTLACFTNEHAACYALTRAQLDKAMKSGGFDVPPHEGKYDMLCAAATDVYTQCGLTKLIPVSRLDAFTVHHMSNRYAGKMGLPAKDFTKQTEALMRIADGTLPPRALLPTETRLWRAEYSKDYYEPAREEIVELVPASARSVLSVGCGSGATEIALAARGLRVAAIPLDFVIAAGAAEAGVELIEGDLVEASRSLEGRAFDCILLLNVLHLTPDPAEALSLFGKLLAPGAPIIVQSPHMAALPIVWRRLRDRRNRAPQGFAESGAHFVSGRSVEKWCRSAGLTVERAADILHRRVEHYEGVIPLAARRALASDIVVVARPAASPAKHASRQEEFI